MRTTSRPVPRGRTLAFALIGGLILAVSACQSSASSAAGGGGSGTSTAANASADVVAAKAAVQQASKAPTAIGVTQPLKSKPSGARTYVFLGVPFGSVAYNIDGLEAATAAVGWNLKVLNYDQTNPATLLSALQEALQYHPVAVSLTGIDFSLWKSVLPAYQKAGVPIIPDCDPTPINNVVIANPCGAIDFNNMGTTLANWFIDDSNGAGHALVVNFQDFPILEDLATAFTGKVKQSCPGCTIEVTQASVAQATNGSETQEIVSLLQRDPSINYLVVPFSEFAPGLPAALSAAGLAGKVKIALQGPTKADLASLKAGQLSAVMPLASSYQGWLDVDVALRHLEGMRIPVGDGGLPTQLLTPGSSLPASDDYQQPADFPEQFKQLWHVG